MRREREVELQATNGVFSQAFACVVFVLSLSWQTVVGFYQGVEGGKAVSHRVIYVCLCETPPFFEVSLRLSRDCLGYSSAFTKEKRR
eukprot:COSAG06_NODE_54182_length_296_cov_0.522843_1_plen_86_part_10